MDQTSFESIRRSIDFVIISGGIVPFVIVPLVQVCGHICSKKINSQEELDSIVEKEAKKLDLDTNKIRAKYIPYKYGRSPTKKVCDKYHLYAREGITNSVIGIRHELYHILKDCDRKKTWPYYFFIAEPRAMIYSCFGIKL